MDYNAKIDVIGNFDVIIAGGGPAGIAAAVSATDMGMSVLIIERAGVVGGNLTIGHVCPVSGDYEKNTMADFINSYLSVDIHGTCNFENAKTLLTELLYNKGVTVYLNSSVCDVIKNENKITALIISTQSGLKAVKGKMFIDATGDGVLSYLAGEKTEYGRNDGLVQPMSVMFTISGVAEEQTLMCSHEAHDTKLKNGSYLNLCKEASKNGELPPEIGIVRIYHGPTQTDRVINATQINRLNPIDINDYTTAQIKLRNQIKMVVEFLRKNIEGFGDIQIKDSSDIVGIRESRRVIGEYIITAENLIEGCRFDDVVVHKANFAIDIHNPDGAGQAESDATPHFAQPYDIPYRATVPCINDNLYLAGRCISGTHRAHASYRVMNIAMNIGETAGISASLCIKNNCTNKCLDYKEVQNVLLDKNINLFD